MTEKTLLVDCRIYKESENQLINMGYKITKLDNQRFLDTPVSAHPDMLAVKVKNTWFIDSTVNKIFTFAGDVIEFDREVVFGKKLQYPDDVAFNCSVFGNNLLCNRKFLNKEILNFAEQCGMRVINTNQGYTKCSTCVVSDNAIITEDDDIYKCCKTAGVDVLKIRKGYVKLPGYDYGFIGGCSGLVEENKLFFNGCIERHPDYTLIKEFCGNYAVEAVSLCDNDLYDIGSIFTLN